MAGSKNEGFTIWFTGMSGAGKSTLANYIGARLVAAGKRVEILDGDDAGQLLGYELGETIDERDLASRRVGFVAKLLSRNGVVAIGATVSPYRALREELRREIGRFVEVFTDCEVEVLIKRDVKGLYKRALSGELPHFVGITEPYEPPANPEVTIDTAVETVQDAAERIVGSLHKVGYLSGDEVKVALFGKTKEASAAKRRAAKKAETAARAMAISVADDARRKAAGLPADKSGSSLRGRGAGRRTDAQSQEPKKAAKVAEPEKAAKVAEPKKAAKKAEPKKAAKKAEPKKAAKKAEPKKAAKKAEPKKAAKKAEPKKAAKKAEPKKAEPKKAAPKKAAKKAAKKAEPKKAAKKAEPKKAAPKAKVSTKRAGAAKKGERKAAKVVSKTKSKKGASPAK